jgi:hypothetical protein
MYVSHSSESTSIRRAAPGRHWLRLALAIAILVGVIARVSVLSWSDPWGPHHPDENFLPFESIALWEGVSPRELGWPASTTRLAMSAAAAVKWFAESGGEAWQRRDDPQAALETVATWIGRRVVDSAPLYKIGRLVSVTTGIAQILAVVWALRRWVGPSGVVIGTLGASIAPLAVLHSQYVLADVAGLLCATLVVGLAADPKFPRIVTMAALAGLAAASKYHFGLWILAPLGCLWLNPEQRVGSKALRSLGVAAVTLWVIVTLVPWAWFNPLLPVKEFGFVVLGKVGGSFTMGHVIHNIALIFGGLGAVTWVGAALGLSALRPSHLPRVTAVLLPLAVGVLLLVKSGIVFDRHGLVLMPGLTILAALGWEQYLSSERARVRAAALVALVTCVLSTGVNLVRAEQEAGDASVDTLATQWILSNVAKGSRVAVPDEITTTIPRAKSQLQDCAAKPQRPEAYLEKWRALGYQPHHTSLEPMRSAVLNDELYYAYWCSRELAVQQEPGFFVVPYHNEPRFNAVLEDDVLSDFRSGSIAATGGVDVLVINRIVDVGVAPTIIVRNGLGQRVIYVK